MKNLFSVMMLAVLASCTNAIEDGLVVNKQLQSTSQQSYVRSREEVSEIALDALDLTGKHCSRSENVYLENVIPVLKPLSRSNTNADTLFFIANYSGENGFCVIAADKRIDPLIAVTEKGNYSVREENVPEGFVEYMYLAREYVSACLENVDDTPAYIGIGDGPMDKTKTWVETSIEWISDIEPRVSVQWGQQFEFGAYCKNLLAGCGPIAAAQAMTYFKQPTSFSGKYEEFRSKVGQGVQQHNFVVNWEAVSAHNGASSSQDNCSVETHNTISRLCRYLGFASSASYGTNGTSVTLSGLSNAMKSMGYTTKIANYSGKNGTELGNNAILLMAGKDNANGVSHIWVMDGCKYYKKTQIMYSQKEPEPPVALSKTVTDYYLHHFNWGEFGNCNGWFNDKIYMTNNASTKDNPNGSNNLSMNFSTNVQYIRVTR